MLTRQANNAPRVGVGWGIPEISSLSGLIPTSTLVSTKSARYDPAYLLPPHFDNCYYDRTSII